MQAIFLATEVWDELKIEWKMCETIWSSFDLVSYTKCPYDGALLRNHVPRAEGIRIRIFWIFSRALRKQWISFKWTLLREVHTFLIRNLHYKNEGCRAMYTLFFIKTSKFRPRLDVLNILRNWAPVFLNLFLNCS